MVKRLQSRGNHHQSQAQRLWFFRYRGQVNDYCIVRSDYRPTKSQAAAMLIDKRK